MPENNLPKGFGKTTGRKFGSKNKSTLAREALEALGFSPLGQLSKIAINAAKRIEGDQGIQKNDVDTLLEISKVLLPYEYSKATEKVDVTTNGNDLSTDVAVTTELTLIDAKANLKKKYG